MQTKCVFIALSLYVTCYTVHIATLLCACAALCCGGMACAVVSLQQIQIKFVPFLWEVGGDYLLMSKYGCSQYTHHDTD